MIELDHRSLVATHAISLWRFLVKFSVWQFFEALGKMLLVNSLNFAPGRLRGKYSREVRC